jgi:hypothetical protein
VSLRNLFRDAFYLYTRETRPCPDGDRCIGEPHDDDYGSWVSGCGYCNGTGSYVHREYYSVGWLMKNAADAAWLALAFEEGYSAGVTDARAS